MNRELKKLRVLTKVRTVRGEKQMGEQLGWMMAMPLEYSGALLLLAALVVIALGTGVLFAIFKGIERVGSKDPLTIAKERYARGDISEEEFRSIVKELGHKIKRF